MRPTAELDIAVLRENARAWRAYAGIPIRAVVKSNGYGWGLAAVVRALDDLVEGFVVADVDECEAVRVLSGRPILPLQGVPVSAVARLLEVGVIPNLVSLESIQAAIVWARERRRAARIRLGLSPALGWSGFEPDALEALAPVLACRELEIEFWTHLTHPTLIEGQRAAFSSLYTKLLELGVPIVSVDLESTSSSAYISGSCLRLGVGLFGARYESLPLGVRCALRLEAPVVDCFESRGQFVGYTAKRAPEHGYLQVVRCGYGDGFVRMSSNEAGIIAVGMQYTVLWKATRPQGKSVMLLDASSDLDALAREAGVAPHEIVLNLGNSARKAECLEYSENGSG